MSGNGPKIFIAVLFLIAILFVVALNLAATHSADDQKFQTPGWMTNIGTTIARPQSLQLTDLSPTPVSCIRQSQIVVPVGQACTFAIHQSLFAVRTATLQLVQGTSAMVTLTQEKTLPIQQQLVGVGKTTNANDAKVYPGKTHGTLVVTCMSTGNASITTCLFKLMK